MWTVLFVMAAIVLSGFYYNFSPQWESRVTSIATICALFILFLLQKSQNHNDKATHLKLDELVTALDGARNEVAAIEKEDEAAIESLKNQMEEQLARQLK